MFVAPTAGSTARSARGEARRLAPRALAGVAPAPAGPPSLETLLAADSTVVKAGIHRRVLRVELESGSYFLKHYRSRGWGRSLSHLFRASAARREWAKSRELVRRGVATITPVAFYERRRYGLVDESFFLSREIPAARPLDEALASRPVQLDAPAGRRRLIEQLARFVADAHQAGVDHDDLHLGNILVQGSLDDEAGPRLYLIDVPNVRLGRPLTRRKSLASLVMLCSALAPLSSRADRQRFWRAYALRRWQKQAFRRDDPSAIERRTREYQFTVLVGRDRRALRENRDFHSLAESTRRVHALAEMTTAQMRNLIRAPERSLRANLHRAVKLARGSALVEAVLVVGDRPRHVAYKRYRPKSPLKALFDLARGSRARRAWVAGHALLARSIATARPLAMCDSRRPWPGTSYLVTEWIEGAPNLHHYAWHLSSLPAQTRARRTRQLAGNLGALVGRLHRWRYAHRDLKGCNLVAVETAESVQAYVVDLDGLRQRRRLSSRAMYKNLARLASSLSCYGWLTRADRARFLRTYRRELGRAGAGAVPGWKELWREVAARVKNRRETVICLPPDVPAGSC